MKKLTAKEAKFVDEYLIDLNASAAARRAGYSEKTAYRIGYENLRKPHIEEALMVARQRLSVESGITPEMVIKARGNIAFCDIAECYTEDGNLKNIHDIPKAARMALAGLDVFEVFGGSGEDKVAIGITKKVKRWDPPQGLDSLAKHFGLYDADKSQQANVKWVICGTKGQSIEECITQHGSVELTPDD